MLFGDARLKIERADEHIADIKGCIAALIDSDVSSVEFNSHMGNEVIKHDVTDVGAARKIALRIGDAVHNLKCALDYLWLETIETRIPTAVGDFAKFPVYRSRNQLEGVLKGREIHIASPDLFKLLMSDIQPYDGGNEAIWPIHRLDIMDKHRLLLPIVHYGSVTGIESEDESGLREKGGTYGTWQKFPWYVHVRPGVRVTNKGKLTISVLFGEGTPVRHLEVVSTLSYFSELITKTVELFEKL
ncbi:MAG: hypothetical protein ACXWOH_12545 [Bdellovibrionota bacterium]